MKWSWRIATVSGIGIYLHGTFLILVAYLVMEQLRGGGGIMDAVGIVLLLAAVFTIVVLHELGHAFAARRYGIKTQDITLLPIGGVARLESIPEDPKQELVVAIAGPAVNAVLFGLCLVGLIVLTGAAYLAGALDNIREAPLLALGSIPHVRSAADLPAAGAQILLLLLYVNGMMILFNLLPAFPMDGGRVLRAVLAMWTDRVRATRMAAQVGQSMAVLFALVGLFSQQYMLVFIAVFVWLGAGAEAAQVESRSTMGGMTVRNAMITRFQTVAPDNSLGDVTEHIVRGYQQDFPVVAGDDIIGMLTRNDLLKALVQHGRDARVSDVMQRTFERAQAAEQLAKVFERLQTCQCHSLPVLEHGKLVGVIDMENVGEFIALRSAMRSGIRA